MRFEFAFAFAVFRPANRSNSIVLSLPVRDEEKGNDAAKAETLCGEGATAGVKGSPARASEPLRIPNSDAVAPDNHVGDVAQHFRLIQQKMATVRGARFFDEQAKQYANATDTPSTAQMEISSTANSCEETPNQTPSRSSAVRLWTPSFISTRSPA